MDPLELVAEAIKKEQDGLGLLKAAYGLYHSHSYIFGLFCINFYSIFIIYVQAQDGLTNVKDPSQEEVLLLHEISERLPKLKGLMRGMI
jgi:hypothetical protein